MKTATCIHALKSRPTKDLQLRVIFPVTFPCIPDQLNACRRARTSFLFWAESEDMNEISRVLTTCMAQAILCVVTRKELICNNYEINYCVQFHSLVQITRKRKETVRYFSKPTRLSSIGFTCLRSLSSNVRHCFK